MAPRDVTTKLGVGERPTRLQPLIGSGLPRKNSGAATSLFLLIWLIFRSGLVDFCIGQPGKQQCFSATTPTSWLTWPPTPYPQTILKCLYTDTLKWILAYRSSSIPAAFERLRWGAVNRPVAGERSVTVEQSGNRNAEAERQEQRLNEQKRSNGRSPPSGKRLSSPDDGC